MIDDKGEGEVLARVLEEDMSDIDIVLVTSIEDLDLGRVVAHRLGVPLDTVIAEKLLVPGNQGSALGSVAERKTLWVETELLERYDIREDYVRSEMERKLRQIREKLSENNLLYQPDLSSLNVLLVESSIDNAMNMMACIGSVIKAGANSISVSSIRASDSAIDQLKPHVNNLIYLEKSVH